MSVKNCIFASMRFYLLCLLACVATTGFAQSSYIPLGSYSMHQLDRFEIKSGRLAEPSEFNTSTKSYQRHRIATYVDSFNLVQARLSSHDYFNLAYLQNDNFEYTSSESTRSKRSIFGLYKEKAALYKVEEGDFKLVVNPVAFLQAGYDTRLKSTTMVNNRGIEIRGSIGKSIGFYTQFSDEISKLNSWTLDLYRQDSIVPGAGLLKTSDNYRTFNYGLASGYIVFQPNRYIDVQFGHGRNYLGNGYHTFYMSDFSRDHLYLRVNTRIWKIQYTNIFGELHDYINSFSGVRRNPTRHYYATTYASINLSKKVNLGIFQTVVFQRDSGYADGGYDPQYLNPIILYKPVENGLNSPDKTIMGADIKYNFARHFSLYGQAVISEFVMKEVLSGNNWWGNKQAFQLGLKYIDVLNISNLDLQVEYNQARPYMYTSYTSLNAYTNNRQSMAHPLGANFRELVAIARYQPFDKLFLTGKAIVATYGNDTANSNWGKNIALPFGTRMREYDNVIGQGVKTNLYLFDLTASYMVKHNLFIDLQMSYRKTSSEMNLFNSETVWGTVSFRWNISQRMLDF